MGALPKMRMTVGEYLTWSELQDEGKFELVDGEVIAMSPETIRHVQVKNEAWLALRNAISNAGVPCTAFGDGAGVMIGDATVREPDVTVQCKPVDPDALLLDEPVIVVEVVSPSSKRSDTGAKVAEYFKVTSILHYLILDPNSRSVVKHSRRKAGEPIWTEIAGSGAIELAPPGISIAVEDFFGPPS